MRGKSVAQVTDLFIGPTGSSVTIRAVRNIKYTETDSFEVQLLRGKSDSGAQTARAILDQDIQLVKKMHADIANTSQLRAENEDLDWALKQQQDENRIHTQQLNVFKQEAEKVEDQLEAALKQRVESDKVLTNLRQQLEAVSQKLTDMKTNRQHELDALEERLKIAERERDMALQARDFSEQSPVFPSLPLSSENMILEVNKYRFT